MKKRLLTVLLFTFGLLISNAQDQGDFELGINAGLNLSNLASSDDDFESDSRVSFNIAASGEYYFSDRWGIKTKLIFDKKGFGDDDNDVNVNIDYITIPVMANWHFGSNRNWYLNFGVYGGFLLNAEIEFEGFTEDIKDVTNDLDFGVAFGIGYKFNVNDNTKLFFEYDAQSGISSIDEDSDETFRNGRSSLNFGVLFNL